MLALDSTIGCIEASEPDVLDIFRSSPLTMPLASGSVPALCEAYVCAIRKKECVQVYAALVADNKRIFVYTTSGKPDSVEDYPQTLQDALDFIKAMGFSPERLNLNYSPAMREVMMRNIKILRPPGSKVQALLKHGTANAPASAKKPGTHKNPAPAVPPAAPAIPPATPSVSAAVTSVEASAVLAANMAKQEAELAALVRAKDALERQVQGLTAQRDEAYRLRDTSAAEHEQLTEALSRARLDMAGMLLERDTALCRNEQIAADGKLAKERAAAAEKLAIAQIAAAEKRVIEQVAAAEKLAKERAAAAEKLAAVQGEALQAELAALAAQNDAALLRTQDLERVNLLQAAEVRALQQEVATLAAERDAARLESGERDQASQRSAAQVRVLQQKVATLAAERDAARLGAGNLEQASRSSAAQVQVLQQKLAALAAERDAALLRAKNLAAEGLARAAEFAAQREIWSAPDTGLLGLPEADGMEALADATWEAEPSGLPHHFEDAEFLPEPEGFDSPPATALEENTGQQTDQAALAAPTRTANAAADWYDASSEKLLALPYHEDDGDFFPAGEEPEGCPGRFKYQAGLAAVEYAAPADVLELHQSINLAQVSPDGQRPTSCQGYICCLKRADGTPRVFVAIYGAQSEKTWVYLPEVPPVDQADYAKAVTGAIGFAEEVGFIMEPMHLDTDRKNLDKAVLRCPVLKKTK
jgi:hypothetical protein